MSFDGKVVLITGSGSGIGADAARHLTELGAKVSIVDLNEKCANEVADEIKKSGAATPLVIVGDVTRDAERIVNETIKHFGKLDVLVNNAGIASKDCVLDVKPSDFDRVFNTNVLSALTLTQLCAPHLEKTKGNIVNIASIAGLKAIPNFTTYCITKAALIQLTNCAALDLAPKRIRVNSICPGPIRTPIYRSIGISTDEIEQMFEGIKSKYPVGRMGEVSDISAAIAFLADNRTASFITGVNLPVDGGAMVAGLTT